jgi:hypothetical protein
VANQGMHAAERLSIPANRLKPLFKATWTLCGQLTRLAEPAKETGLTLSATFGGYMGNRRKPRGILT